MVFVPGGRGVIWWKNDIIGNWSVKKSFFIDKFEITIREYRKYLEPLSKVQKRDLTPTYWEQTKVPQHNKFPVIGVSWRQAALYCKAMAKRLPASVEWMMAAVRKGEESAGPKGVARFNEDKLSTIDSTTQVELSTPFFVYGEGLRPVGSVEGDVSAFGVFDMAGGVSEWLEWSNKEHNMRSIIGPHSKSLGPISHRLTHVEDHGGRFWLGFRCAKDVSQ